MRFGLLFITMVFLVGCVHLPRGRDRAGVSHAVEERTGMSLGQAVGINQLVIPAGLDQGKKLTEDEAVLIALYNNPAFQELLTDLALTKADLVQAGLLPNPEIIYFFGVPNKPFKYAVELPIEAIWLRPIRMKIAERENARAAERLTQAALDLIRDTRRAYADVLLASERKRVAQEAIALRGAIAGVAEKRLKAGDASEQEAATARIDALLATQEAIRIDFELPLAEERLRNLLGLGGMAFPMMLDAQQLPPRPSLKADELSAEAVQTRPDALSAEQFVAAAEERLRLSKLGWVRFFGILDATSGRLTGHEFGPAFRVTLPIFNRNQGGIARAQAEFEQATQRRLTVRNQIYLDVRQSLLTYEQADAELKILRDKIRPQIKSAITLAEKAYAGGGAPYVLVLETQRQLIDTFYREALLHADRRRAWAELERSVGHRLTLPPPAVQGPTP
ncbi:MAG: TolC family protein [Planctomycetes bacterium]|nr:TolC family protein [Planctomycetota bacterium]